MKRIQANYLSMLPLGLAAVATSSPADAKEKKVNVIYILADDLGYGDLSCYGQQKFKTPHIDRLAAEGMLFTQHYAGSTVSAPSRSALLTGQHTGHTPIRGNKEMKDEGQWPIPANTYTLAKMFKSAGYTTGAFGKWGLGFPGSEGDPLKQGFDEFYGYNCQREAHRYYPKHLWHNDKKIYIEGNDSTHTQIYAGDLIHKEAMRFIRENVDKPFFAFLPYTIPHAELIVPNDQSGNEYLGKFEEKPFVSPPGGDYGADMVVHLYNSQPHPHAVFAAMIARLDQYVGEIVDFLKQNGLAENTIVVFTSDNGPHREGGADPDFFQSYGPFRGIKRDLYEGGIRAPFIAWLPSHIKAGSRSDLLSANWDMLPTFAEIAGTKIPKDLPVDGISILPELLGKKGQKEHKSLYWEFHEQGGKIALRMGKWKLIKLNVSKEKNKRTELYDLSADIHEDQNVADKYPEIVNQLEQIIEESRTDSPLFIFNHNKLSFKN